MARLLILISRLEAVGGTERVVLGLARSLSKSHEVHVVCFALDSAATRPAGVQLHVMSPGAERSLALRALTYFEQARKLRRLKKTLRPDVSISNLWRADFVNVLSRTGERKVAVLHAGVRGPANRLLRRFRWLAAWTYKQFAELVAVSPGIAEEAERFYGVPRRRIRVIPNAVEIGTVSQDKKTSDLLWCGRFTEEKNPLGAVAVFGELLARQPELRVVMIGDGPLLTKARAAAGKLAAKKAGPGRIAFLGAKATAAPDIGKSRLLVSTSVTESFGLAILEAMIQAVPVAAADSAGGGPHYLLDARTSNDPRRKKPETTNAGVLLPVPEPGTPSIGVWADTVAKLLDEPKTMAALGHGTSKRAHAFSMESSRRAWEELIDEVVA